MQSFAPRLPSCLFVHSSMSSAASFAGRSSCGNSASRAEIMFWMFVDTFTAPIPFRRQQHFGLTLYTDASGFAWGAQVQSSSGLLCLRDYWSDNVLTQDICVKEGLAVLLAVSSLADSARDCRLDVYTDNQGLLHAWSGLKSSSPDLVGVFR